MNQSKAVLLFLSVLFVGPASFAFPTPFGFVRQQTDKIVFTTTAQSINAKACSGVVTVQNRNGAGVAKNVTSPLTVSLTAVAGLTYFSDSTCTAAITDITIATGTSSSSFYFLSSVTGTKTLTASATGYQNTSQNETINTNPHIWTGANGDGNWNTAGNWSGNAVPNASQVAIFDGTCSSCAATINAVTSVGGIRIESDYIGSISQSAALTVGAGSYVQFAGTFTGGSAAITISRFALAGGTFTSTTGTLKINGPVFKVLNSPTFNHNNGKVAFSTGGVPVVTGVGGISFYNVDILGDSSWSSVNLSGTMNVLGSLLFKNFGYGSDFNGTGTINVSGNVDLEGTTWTVNKTMNIKMVGTGTVTGSGTGAIFGAFEIATAGTVTFATTGSVDIAGNFKYTSGTVVTTNSLVRFVGVNQDIEPGVMAFRNVYFSNRNTGTGITTVTGTMTVLGDLTLYCGNYSLRLDEGTINLSGNLNITGDRFFGGTTLVRMVGTGTITGSGAGSAVSSLEIDTAGTVTFATTGSVDIWGDFTYKNGTVVTTGSTVRIIGSTPVAINSGSMIFQNLTFSQSATAANTLTGTIYINGNLSFIGSGYWPAIDGGSMEVKGNVSVSGGWTGGTTSLVLTGGGVQTMSHSGATSKFPGAAITVNNASSVLTLASNVPMNTNQGLVVTAGSVNMAGYAFTMKTLSLNSNTLTKNTGVLTVNGVVAGTGSLYGGTVAP